MALITCPHCGKQVSDTATKCIHCGGKLKEAPLEPKEYTELSFTEKEALDSEFERRYPEYAYLKFQKRNKMLTTAFLVFLIMYLLFMTLGIILFVNGMNTIQNDKTHSPDILKTIFTNPNIILGLVAVTVGIIALFSYIAITVLFYRNRKNYLLNYKIFVKWLLTKKKIVYHPEFSRRQQSIYNQFNVENYKL